MVYHTKARAEFCWNSHEIEWSSITESEHKHARNLFDFIHILVCTCDFVFISCNVFFAWSKQGEQPDQWAPKLEKVEGPLATFKSAIKAVEDKIKGNHSIPIKCEYMVKRIYYLYLRTIGHAIGRWTAISVLCSLWTIAPAVTLTVGMLPHQIHNLKPRKIYHCKCCSWNCVNNRPLSVHIW